MKTSRASSRRSLLDWSMRRLARSAGWSPSLDRRGRTPAGLRTAAGWPLRFGVLSRRSGILTQFVFTRCEGRTYAKPASSPASLVSEERETRAAATPRIHDVPVVASRASPPKQFFSCHFSISQRTKITLLRRRVFVLFFPAKRADPRTSSPQPVSTA